MEFQFPKTLSSLTLRTLFSSGRTRKILSVAGVVSLISLTVFIQSVFAVKEQHAYIFPLSVQAEGWVSPEKALTQDLPEDAVTADFSSINSAFISSATSSEPVISLPVEDVPVDSNTQTLEETMIEDVPEEQSVPLPPEEGTSTPLSKIFLPVAHAQEATTTSSINDAGTRCSVRGTECYTMQFSGFSLGGALDHTTFTKAALVASFGGEVKSSGRLSVSYQTSEGWKLAGEMLLVGDISNTMRGGYLRFPLPDIATWESLGDMNVLVEFSPDAETQPVDAKIFFDALWVDVGFEQDEQIDLAQAPNVVTELEGHSESLQESRASILDTGKEQIVFSTVPDEVSSGISLKAHQVLGVGLQNAEYILSLTNTTDQDISPSLSLFSLPEATEILDASFWDKRRTVTRTAPVYGVTGYYCELGWEHASSSDIFSCAATNEERLCTALNETQTNCIVEGEVVRSEEQEVVQPGWSPLVTRPYADVSGIATLFGQYDAKASIPEEYQGQGTVALDHILAPRETTYIKVKIRFPENTTGAFSLFAFGDTGASAKGNFSWDSVWTKRLPVYVHKEGDTGELGVVVRIPIDASQETFWNEVQPNAGDVRLVDDEAGIEVPYGFTEWNYEKRHAELWARLSTLRPQSSSSLSVYFGNANAEPSEDLLGVLATEQLSPRSIVLGNDVGAISVDVSSFRDGERLRIGDGSLTSVDRGQIETIERVRSGEIIYATGPISSVISGGDQSHVVVPLSLAGRMFVVPETTKGREIFLAAVNDPVRIQVSDLRDASTTGEEITLIPGEPSRQRTLAPGMVVLRADDPFVVAIRGEGESSPSPLSPAGKDMFAGMMRDRLLISTVHDGSSYTIGCTSGVSETKDGRRAGETFRSVSCGGGLFDTSDIVEVRVGDHPVGVVGEGEDGLLSFLPGEHFGKETIIPFATNKIAIACPLEQESHWAVRLPDGSLVRAGNCLSGQTRIEKEVLVAPDGGFPAGLIVQTTGTTSSPVIVLTSTVEQDDVTAPNRIQILGGEVSSRGEAAGLQVVLGQTERVFPHDRRPQDKDSDGNDIKHVNDLLSLARDFSAKDIPEFRFKFLPKTSALLSGLRDALGMVPFTIEKLTLVHSAYGEVDADIEVVSREGDEWVVRVKPKSVAIRPGKYRLQMVMNDNGELVEDAFDFYWGMLAVNTDQGEYAPDSDVLITAGALTNSGNTICDANLHAQITRPNGEKDDLDLPPSGFCSGNNVTSVPDYFVQYHATSTGTYLLRLVELDREGVLVNETQDTFVVTENLPYTIRRTGPTRIYPLALYSMNIAVTAREDFAGTLVERIEHDFVVTERGGAFLEDQGDHISATWSIGLKAGETQEFSYTFDAPNLSPYRFHLGPAELHKDDVSVYAELRPWQIASDAAGQMMLFWDDGASTPAGWTCVSCAGADPYSMRYTKGSDTYGTTYGSTTHTHVASSTSVGSAVNLNGSAATPASENTQNNQVITANDHIHNYDPVISSTTSLPLSRTLRIIRSNTAGEVSLPSGAIGIFDSASSSLPTNWYRYAPQDGYFIYGSTTVGTIVGSSTHAHTIGSSTDNSSGTLYRRRNTGTQITAANGSHQHTVNATTSLVAHDPPYLEVVLAKLSTATGSPNGLIAMWNDTPATGWISVSNSNGAFYGKYLKASTTYGGTGGSLTHQPPTLSATTSSSTNNINARQLAPLAGLSSSHFHQISVSFSETDNLPPTTETIFAKRSSGISAYTQEDYQFYVNRNASLPTDPWPSGGSDLSENTEIVSTSDVLKPTDVVRIRMNVNSANSTTTVGTGQWRLQYAAASAGTCASALNWFNVASSSSSTAAWRGYNNSGVADGATLASVLLSTSTAAESYVEDGLSPTTPTQIDLNGNGEWDWVVQNNTATANTNYCFRMVKSDGSLLDSYVNYPEILTNSAPDQAILVLPFDNEATATTSPTFTFDATDAETNDLDYEIVIDDDPAFGSPVFDVTSAANPELFTNASNPTNKAPFTAGDTISYKVTSALTNGTTYWWRVRAIDSSGANTYGSWSSSQSFTIDTSVTVTRWFQTTAAQFQTDTHYGTNATSSTNNYVTLTNGSTTGTTTSSAISFASAATGTAWNQLSWNFNNPGGALQLRVEYYTSTGSWAYIPDADLPGNAAGFTSGPVSLLTVNPATYDIIRVRADFFGFAGSGPRLLDWTVDWGFVVNTPTLSKLIDNEAVGTTTPSFEFYTTDPQGDALMYEFQWSTSPSFTSSTTRTSFAHAGFQNLTTPADTSPFNSGELIRFTIQPADALTASTTYWWRVRATDPGGANTYSFYSGIRSFTVDLSVTSPTWFQTTSGQFDTDSLTGAYTSGTLNAVLVATNTSEAMIVYGEGTVQTPRYRLWSGSSWGTELSAQSISSQTKWVSLKSSGVGGEYLLGTVGADKDTNFQVYSGGSWGNVTETTNNLSNSEARGMDVAWETLSGDGMAVSCNGANDAMYSIWNGSVWTAGTSTVGLGATTSCEWINLASDPASDEIILLERTSSGKFFAAVWNGNSWGSTTTLGQQEETGNEGGDVEYEESGNQAIIVASTPGTAATLQLRSMFWNGSVWSTASSTTIGRHPEWMSLKRDKGSDNMALCYVDNDTDIGTLRWDGNYWRVPATVVEHTTTGNSKLGRSVDCDFENTTGRDGNILTVYTTTANAFYVYYNGAWQPAAPVGVNEDSFIVQTRRTTDDLILTAFFDDANRKLETTYWNGASWAATTSIETSLSDTASPFREIFMMAPKLPTTRATVVSPSIDFDDGIAPAWKDVTFSATTTGSSTIKIQLQYLDASSTWSLVPDSDLAGNSTGFTSTSSAISILNLNTNTYNQIRLKATLTCVLGVCPTLNDWKVRWSPGVDFSGTAKQFDLTSNVTSGTVAVAVNGTLQTGKTGTISAGTWTITNVTAFPGNTLTFFIDGAGDQNEANTVVRYVGPGNMSAIPLYERYLTIGSASSTGTTSPLTNINLSKYDNSVSGDEDIFFDVDAGNDLTVCAGAVSGCGGASLLVNYGTYRPDSSSSGNINTYNLRIDSTLTADGNTVRVGGSWDNNSDFTANTSSVIFTATSGTRTIDSTGAGTSTFNAITFGETSGTSTWSLVSPLVVSGDTSVNFGTLSPGSQAISLDGNLTIGASGFWTKGSATTTFAGSVSKTWTDNTSAKQDLGLVLVDGSSKTLNLGSAVRATDITIGANDTLDVTTGNYGLTVLGNWVNNNVFNARSGTTTFAGGAGALRTINPGTSPFNHLYINGTSTWSFTTTGATTTGTVTIATGTLTLPSGTLAVGGGFQNTGGSFTGGTTVKFTSTASGNKIQAGTSTWPELLFTGSGGSWAFQDTHATTTGQVLISAGTVTLPLGTFAIPRGFDALGGSFTANSGSTLKFTATSSSFTVRANGSSFANLLFAGGGSWTMGDTNATSTGSFQINAGTTTLPSGVFAVGGSFINADKFTHASGTVKMIATTIGNSVTTGNSQLGNLEFSSATGGWTITGNATTSGNFSLLNAGAFTQTSGTTLEARGTFQNLVGGASTTWTGARLWLNSQTNYTLNSKTQGGDVYGIMRTGSGTQARMWNSTSTSYEMDTNGSLYSQDHNAVDGELYVFGNYSRTSGTDYWSYATDFDGTALGGGSRQVTVKLANGATTTFSGTTLQMLGVSTASTTVTNQGSGTYGVVLSNGTWNASYYAFRNLNTQGLQLLATTTITTMDNGDFELAVSGGTTITMSSTTINKNQSLQPSLIRFATTTAITGYNVTALGTATSSIRFRNHYGNLGGEAFDNDPGGNPGYIRWDDSNYVVNISGTVYSDAGVTPMGAPVCDDTTTVVRVKVENGGDFTAPCSSGTATGTFTVTGVTFSGDLTFTIYLDSEGGPRGAVITKSVTTDLTGINIYQNRVILRHEDVSPMTIADMNAWDFNDEPDLPYTVSTSGPNSLVVRSDTELWVWSGKTFAPGGSITLESGSTNSYDGKFHLDNNAVFTGASGETHTIGGGMSFDSGSTFTAGGSSFLLTATNTGKIISAVPSITFSTLTASGTGGGWAFSGTYTLQNALAVNAGTLSGTGNITVQSGGISGAGAFAMTGGTVTVQGTANFGGNTDWSFYNLTFGNGVTVATTTKTGSSTITTQNVLTISSSHTLEASNSRWILLGAGTPITVSGSLSAQTSTFRYASTTAQNIRALSYYRLELRPAGSGSPTYTMLSGNCSVADDLVIGDGVNPVTVTANTNDPTLVVTGNLTIGTSTTFIGSNSGTFSVGGSWANYGTYTHSSGTVTFNAAGTGRTIYASSSSFGSVILNSSQGGWTMLSNATTTGSFSLTQANSFTQSSGTTLEVDGTFTNNVGGASTTWSGTVLHLNSGTAYTLNTKSDSGDVYELLRIGTATDVKMWNSSSTQVTTLGTGSLYSQNHAAVNGDLYIWGDYVRSSGTEYWSYLTDFDGTTLGVPRQATVRFASNASFALTAGGWEAYGSATASTSIGRQGGGGSYALRISGGSTTAQYFQIRNSDSRGLDISGSPTIHNLSDGDFEVAQNGGTGMTVAASAIDANPLKIFFRNRFATTTAISAYNVTATGSSTSAWRFSAHLASTTINGNLGGEYFDNDPGGDPGMLIWDDSAANVFISGVVYADSGVTPMGSSICDGSTPNVRLKVQGLGSYSTYCELGTGLYTISNVIFNPGDTLTVYLDTGGSARGATISMDPATNIINMDIYRNTVILRHEGLTSLAITNIDQYDYNNDTDIPVMASLGAPNTLSVLPGTELRVWSGKTFAPGGNVTIHANASTTESKDGSLFVESGATFQAAGTQSHVIGGQFTISGGGTFTSGNSSVSFTASTTGKTITPSTSAFYDLSFTGSGGGWSFGSVSATATNNVVISGGSVALPSGVFAVGGNFTENTSPSSFSSATGSIVKFTSTATGKTITAGTSTWANLLFAGSGGAWTFQDSQATSTGSITVATGTVTMPVGTFAVAGDFQNSGGVVAANQSSSIKMTATSSATVRMGGSSLGQLLFAGGGTYTMTDTNATTTGSLRILSGTTTLPSGVLEVRQSFVNSDTFTHASGTVKMTGTTTGYFVTAGNSQFANLEFNNAGGGWTMTGNATTSGTFSLLAGTSYTQTSGTTLEVRSTFTNLVGGAATTWTGSRLAINNGSANYTINSKTQGGDLYNILAIGTSTQLRSWNSSASTYEVNPTASLYSQDHAGVDGNVYIFGNYSRTSGTDYWSYATDFDGTALGGSSRVVTVRHASGATSSFSGATLQVTGASGATTTITNQGSGVFDWIMSAGTLSANYFSVRNMATSGLQILGATTLSTFQNGDFELAVNGGTLVSISSTAIDQNASSFYSRMRFATSTSITGHNVVRSGTSSASITFQTHTGNLAGEGFDDDGGDACGQIRFDDSACLFVDQPHYRWRYDDGGEGVPASEWYDVNWSKRKRVTITNSNGTAVTNAAVKFDVEYDSDMQADFDDIRFTDSSGTTSLSYWFEVVNTSATSTVWVKVPTLAAGETVIYMYYGNNTAPGTGSGTSTFTFFDDFEDGSLSDYSGDTSLFSALTTMNYERTYGLGASAGNETAQNTSGIGQASLGISRDTTFRYYQYVNTGFSDEPCFLFGVQSPITLHQNYGICFELPGTDKLTISKNVAYNYKDGGATQLASTTVTWASGWYESRVDWLSTGVITVNVYDANGDFFAAATTTDSTYSSGGVGFTYWYQHGGWDIPRVFPYTAIQPTTVTGPEQSNSGASWSALLDTILSNQLPNQNVRLRLQVKNSGTSLAGEQFRLQVAPKGASPNCQSVSSGSYSDVPGSGSCGSAVACMSASSQFVNHAPTSDLLSVPTGSTFTPGEMLEDTTNQTNSMNVSNGQYTEVEYNFQITSYANAPAYCFRTTKAGTALDNYSKVAEMTVLYPPSITEYHFNNDQNIALVEGATTTIYATGTVTDLNGYTDLQFATTTMYRSGLALGRMCTADQNNCYQIASTSCSFSSCAGNSCQFSCGADIYYFADPTDVGSTYASENWQSVTDIVDSSLTRVTASSTQELYTLRGFAASSTIAYGSVTVGQNSGSYNPTTTIRNTGNTPLNLLVSGTDMTNGSSTIVAANQKYATSSFSYGSCTSCQTLATSPQSFALNLSKPTTTVAVTTVMYWGINVPSGTAATTHTGSNTLTAN